MTQKHGMFRRIALVFGSAAILLSLTACGATQLPSAPLAGGDLGSGAALVPAQETGLGYDVVQVSGSGSASSAPDVATLSLAVSVTAATVSPARTDAAAAMRRVITALTNRGIEEKNIATRSFRIYEEFEYGGEGRKHVGYTVSNGLVVKVDDTDTLGTVIDAAIAAGGDAIRFNEVSFTFSDAAALEKEARKAAVADMQERASQLAEFANRQLGELKAVSEMPLDGVFAESGALRTALASADASTPISVGESEITVTVHGIYELLPASRLR